MFRVGGKIFKMRIKWDGKFFKTIKKVWPRG